MAKVNIETSVYDRAVQAAGKAGYSSVEEFITHCIDAELTKILAEEDAESQVADQLRGLGYIE